MTAQPATAAIAATPADQPSAARDLAVIVPTWNEAENVAPLVARLSQALAGCDWEAVFVDDGSPDGTAAEVRAAAVREPRLRCLERHGERGLSSACIAGMRATDAAHLAVIDADLQHDESLLPRMLVLLKSGAADLVVASRMLPGGDADALPWHRRLMSRLGATLARLVLPVALSDPMSGFFMLRRALFDETAPRLGGRGFKILLDIVAAAPPGLRCRELAYRFRPRHAGRSKLGARVGVEYLLFLVEQAVGRRLSLRIALFAIVGATGVVVHMAALGLLFKLAGLPFAAAQTLATVAAMTSNFLVNNVLTYRDRRLGGRQMLRGLLLFYAVCAVGALANIVAATLVFEASGAWLLAGAVGVVLAGIWNFAVSSLTVWPGLGGRRGESGGGGE